MGAEYQREWRLDHPDKQGEYNKRYRENNIERAREAHREWNRNNLDKMRAHDRVRYAIKMGRMERLPCEICGDGSTHAHHDDYSRPYDVRWLCPIHHKEAHRE